MSRQNLSRANQRYIGRVTYSPYQGDKPGVETSSFYRWKPTGTRAVTFTAGVAAGATTATLSANWSGATGLWPITLSDGEVLNALLANGATTCTFYPGSFPVTGGTYGVPTGPVNAVTTAATVSGQPPVVGASNSIAASQSVASGVAGLLNGTTAGVLDVARNVVAAWTTTAILTVQGLDIYGQPQSEASASGTSFTGKKTYSAITSFSFNASVTAATVGTGNVLGLPFLINFGDFFASMFNEAADAGTLVQPDLTSPATTGTGDPRGTYTPAGTLNGAKFVAALIKVRDDSTQVGSFGVTPV